MNEPRLAVIGPYTWGPFLDRLATALQQRSLPDEVVGYGFGRDVQVWAGKDQDFAARPPRGVIIIPDGRHMFADLLSHNASPLTAQSVGRQAAEHFLQTIRAVSTRHPATTWVLVTAAMPSPGPEDGVADLDLDPFSAALAVFNDQLRTACRETPSWSFFDRGRLSSLWGDSRLYDARLDYLARFPASAEGMDRLAERLAAHWAAVLGQTHKVLALDCDNTLWAGVVGEEGVDGVQIGGDGVGRAYAAFQQALLVLEKRGVLLVLCSRNNPRDVEDVFIRRPEMVLSRSRIAATSIGWGSKSDGLRDLARNLNLALNSFVFLDDNPAEREEVRRALPEVAVPEVPSDPTDLPAFGYDLAWRYFYRVRLSEEDRARTGQYQHKAVFEELSAKNGANQEFLHSLQMKAALAQDPVGLAARAAQLTQKTNQFNLALRRYTEAEMLQWIHSSRHRVFAASLQDRFGDHGWVGLAMVERCNSPDCWRLDNFLVSCRVLGRGFEGSFLDACVRSLREEASLPLSAEYQPGPRNQPAALFAEEAGLLVVHGEPDGRKHYQLPDKAEVQVAHRWIEFMPFGSGS